MILCFHALAIPFQYFEILGPISLYLVVGLLFPKNSFVMPYFPLLIPKQSASMVGTYEAIMQKQYILCI